MFKIPKGQDPTKALQERVAYLEGTTATLVQYLSNRGHMVRSLREKLEAGSIERALLDLMLTLDREAFAKAFAADVSDSQLAGHDAFVSTMSRALRS